MSKHHGEFKIPGGKLLIVDCQVSEGQLKNVQLSGDFFIEPPEVLDQINQLLEGRAVPINKAQLEQGLNRLFSDNVDLFGIDTKGILTVIERALA